MCCFVCISQQFYQLLLFCTLLTQSFARNTQSHDKLRHFVDHICARKGKIFRLNVKEMNKSCDTLLVLMFNHLPILKCLLGRSEPPIALFYVKYCSYRSDFFFYVVFFFSEKRKTMKKLRSLKAKKIPTLSSLTWARRPELNKISRLLGSRR